MVQYFRLIGLALLLSVGFGNVGLEAQFIIHREKLYLVANVPANDVLNVRAEPNSGSEIIGTLSNYDFVYILELDSTKKWGKLSPGNADTKLGWVSTAYLEENYEGSDCYIEEFIPLGFNRKNTQFAIEIFCSGGGESDYQPYSAAIRIIRQSSGDTELFSDVNFYLDFDNPNDPIDYLRTHLRHYLQKDLEQFGGLNAAQLVAGANEHGAETLVWGNKTPSYDDEYNVDWPVDEREFVRANVLKLFYSKPGGSICDPGFELYLNNRSIYLNVKFDILNKYRCGSVWDDASHPWNYSLHSVYCSPDRRSCFAVVNRTRAEFELEIHHTFLFIPLPEPPLTWIVGISR